MLGNVRQQGVGFLSPACSRQKAASPTDQFCLEKVLGLGEGNQLQPQPHTHTTH